MIIVFCFLNCCFVNNHFRHMKNKENKEAKVDTEETKHLSIGAKRNIASENATGEYIVCMDDDDYYTPESVKFRVATLIHLNKNLIQFNY